MVATISIQKKVLKFGQWAADLNVAHENAGKKGVMNILLHAAFLAVAITIVVQVLPKVPARVNARISQKESVRVLVVQALKIDDHETSIRSRISPVRKGINDPADISTR